MAGKNLTGKRFGKLIAIEKTDKRTSSGNIVWKCKCDCGNITFVGSGDLNSNHTKSCGCLQKEKASVDLLNKKFGKLTVIKKTTERDSYGSVIWECKCECGKIKKVSTKDLNSGHVKSCGCSQYQFVREKLKKDLTNQKFGKLLVIEEAKEKQNNKTMWKCKCDCGNIINVRSDSLTTGNTQSCGCLKESHGSYLINNLLLKNNISFTKEKTFPNCRFPNTNAFARFDYWVENTYLIEYDGEQHFKEGNIDFFRDSLEKRQEHDAFKNNWCKENNIPLIRIPYTHLKDICLEDLLLETSDFIVK